MPIETGGKRGRRIAVSQAAVEVTGAELTQTMVEIRTAVRRAYVDRLIAEARLSLFQELQGLAVRARDAARQRFDAGSAPRLEVLQAELARADAENQVTTAEGAATAARIQLNALLALPHEAPTALATPLDVGPPPATETVRLAQAASADVVVLDRLLDEQRARVALATAMQVPDLAPEATVTRGAEPEFSTGWRVGLSVAVPLFTRHRAGVRVEEATLAQLTAEREAAVARIAGEVTAAVALVDSQRQQYVRYRDDIVPQAIEVERLAEDSYRLGQTGIAAYLQALQASRDVRLRTVQAAADYHSALADLERAIGAPLP
jgi:cobalt-zinc-cadmium efflux system outer membrane protein